MSEKQPELTYSDAGVNIDAADEALRNVKGMVKKTFNDNVLCDIGTFGAMYQFDKDAYEEPVLVSSVDGVGTKLKLAFMTGIHDTVGIDLVSHCVNDILVQGAKPIFFLDYLAVGVLEPAVVEAVLKGIATGCCYAGCALIGGETAEMPGMYIEGEYDLAGTIVGVVDKKKIVDGSRIEPGDVIIGLGSSGLHTNGYSLARKICFEIAGLGPHDPMDGTDMSVAEALMKPHRSYAKVIQLLPNVVDLRGMCHVTGGGITDNLPRTLPDACGAEIDLTTWEVPPIFKFLKEKGNVPEHEMLRTFNNGMGYLIVMSEAQADSALSVLTQACEEPKVIGRVVAGANEITYKGSLQYAS